MSWQLLTNESTSLHLELENDKIKSIESSQKYNQYLNLIENQKRASVIAGKGYDFDSLYNSAKELLPYGEKVLWDYIPSSKNILEKKPILEFEKGLNQKDLLDLGSKVIKKAKKRFPSLSFEVKINYSTGKTSLKNSLDFEDNYTQKEFFFSISALSMEKEKIFSWDGEISTFPKDNLEFDKRLELILDEFEISLKESNPSKSILPCIFSPFSLYFGVLSPFTEALSPSLFENKTSPLLEKTGQKIFDESIQIYQNADIIPFDDYGLKSEKKTWIENGVLKDTPVPLDYSKKLNRAPMGASFSGDLFPDFNLKAGSHNLSDMIKDMEEGVLLIASPNLTQGNVLSGQLSGNISMGLHIKNGKFMGRLTNKTIGIDFYKTFNENLVSISKETEQFGTTDYQTFPYICVKEVSIS